MRLDKLLSNMGVGSRKEIKKMLGRVRLNGAPVKSGDTKVDTDKDVVCFDGNPLTYEKHRYLVLYKPKGVVSATKDKNAHTVLDILPDHLKKEGLFPAGRLDKDTTGLMIITDDGDFAHDILSPKKHVPKEYLVTLDKEVDQSLIPLFEEGVQLEGEKKLKSAQLVIDTHDPHICSVVLSQGLYHQIKRMFLKFGYTVVQLHRTAMGSLRLPPDLKEGQARVLTKEELAQIKS